jgi:hypothetical protein
MPGGADGRVSRVTGNLKGLRQSSSLKHKRTRGLREQLSQLGMYPAEP